MSTLPDTPDSLLQDPLSRINSRASGVFVISVALLFVAFIVWGAYSKLDRVTRGSGRIVSEERNSLIQHYEGGIIKQLLIKEGDSVSEGDVLMRIENRFAEAELASNRLALATHNLARLRLQAEAQGADSLALDALSDKADPVLIAQQIRLFERRKEERFETLAVLDDQVAQKELELSEKKSRLANRRREKTLMAERLASLRQLSLDGALARNELLGYETQYQQLLSQISDLEHQVLQMDASLDEGHGRRREAALSFRSEAERELVEIDFEIAKLEKTISALKDRRLRFDVIAPVSGTINKLFVGTVNGVVRPGQNLAEIVVENAPIAIEAKITPKDRAKVRPGLTALVKVSAYDYTLFGGINGVVTDVSPDALQDENGNIYFRVRIEATVEHLGAANPVVPGMLAEVDIISGQHTILDYILKPIRDVQSRALRE